MSFKIRLKQNVDTKEQWGIALKVLSNERLYESLDASELSLVLFRAPKTDMVEWS